MQVLMLLIYTLGVAAASQNHQTQDRLPASRRQGIFRIVCSKWAYLWGFAGVEIYCAALHKQLFQERLPFLPLLLISVYSAVGVVVVWLNLTARLLSKHSLKLKDV